MLYSQVVDAWIPILSMLILSIFAALLFLLEGQSLTCLFSLWMQRRV